MAVKNIIGRGVGFGAVTWVVTRGFGIGAAIVVDDDIVHVRVKIRDRSPTANLKHRPMLADVYSRTANPEG